MSFITETLTYAISIAIIVIAIEMSKKAERKRLRQQEFDAEQAKIEKENYERQKEQQKEQERIQAQLEDIAYLEEKTRNILHIINSFPTPTDDNEEIINEMLDKYADEIKNICGPINDFNSCLIDLLSELLAGPYFNKKELTDIALNCFTGRSSYFNFPAYNMRVEICKQFISFFTLLAQNNRYYMPFYLGATYLYIARNENVTQRKEYYVEAFKWLEFASEKGDVLAQYNLGLMYYNYEGVQYRDYDKAFELFSLSAKKDFIPSFYPLGECYQNGHGTKIDYQKAGDCFKYATENGIDCTRELDNLYTSGKWNKNKYSPENIFLTYSMQLNKKNFDTISQNLQKVKDLYKNHDINLSAITGRETLEQIINSFILSFEPSFANNTLAEKIDRLSQTSIFPKDVRQKCHTIRLIGNRAVHNSIGETITEQEISQMIEKLDFIFTFYDQYQ